MNPTELNAKKAPKILLIFKDDSSLMAARRFAEIYETSNLEIEYCYAYNRRHKGEELSARQINQTLAHRHIEHRKEWRDVVDEDFLCNFDAIISCKFPIVFEIKWLLNFWNFKGNRPCFVSMFPGIEFTPRLGTRTRQFSDIICLNSPQDFVEYQKYVPTYLKNANLQIQFNPFFFQWQPLKTPDKIEKVVFFTQSIIPASKESRLEVLDTLVECAIKNPNVEILIKLRHLENENKVHTHKEQYSFPSLANESYPEGLPENISFSANHITQLLETTDLCITCASTAGIEAIGAGVPTLFYNSYPGAETEKHFHKMRQFAENSNLLCKKEDIVNLDIRSVNSAWLEQTLTSKKTAQQLLQEIATFPKGKTIAKKPIIGRLVPRILAKIIFNIAALVY